MSCMRRQYFVSVWHGCVADVAFSGSRRTHPGRTSKSLSHTPLPATPYALGQEMTEEELQQEEFRKIQEDIAETNEEMNEEELLQEEFRKMQEEEEELRKQHNCFKAFDCP